jgi:penicillin-binding protein 1A
MVKKIPQKDPSAKKTPLTKKRTASKKEDDPPKTVPPEKKKRRKKRKKKKKSTFFRTLFLFLLILSSFGILAGFGGAYFIYTKYSVDLPDVKTLKDYHPSTITQVYSDADELIAQFFVEKRIIVPIEKIPLLLKQATLAVEDSNFYSHFGIDPKAISRAMITNFKAGRVVEGGSTITQQLAKTLFLTPQKKLERKIREAILSVRLEQFFTKDEILGTYLNQIYYGHGTYGVEAASRNYFGKHVEELTIEECAMIAALPKAPNNYSPYRNMKKAKKRRNHAIRRMGTLGFITPEEEKRALDTPVILNKMKGDLNKTPYFTEYIRRWIQDKYGSSKLYRAGLKVYTTVNLEYQLAAQRAIKENLRIADKRYGYRGPLESVDPTLPKSLIIQKTRALNEFDKGKIPNEDDLFKGIVTEVSDDEALIQIGAGEGIIELEDMKWARPPNVKLDGRYQKISRVSEALSPGDVVLLKVLGMRPDGIFTLSLEQEPEVESGLISISPATGHIKAMVGGYDFSRSEFNRALQAVRQPGSAFKPIVFAAGIENGFTPASIIVDSPVIFKETEYTFDKWKPVNFEKKFYGPTSIRTALTHSRNVVTIKLLQKIGVQRGIEFARKLGIKSLLEENLSIALGSSGMTLFDITAAYAIFANMGSKIEPTGIRYIKDRDDKILYRPETFPQQVIAPGVAYITTSLMESVVQHGTGKKVRVLNRPVAGKTGTTNDFIDAWFLGYTPELATGVWVGKDKDEPLGYNETGSRAAIPIWLQYMQSALQDAPIKNFPTPDDVLFLKIDKETGKQVNFGDKKGSFEVFMKDNLPERTFGAPSSPKQETY